MNIELRKWMTRDLYLCIEMLSRLQPGVLDAELKLFLKFINEAEGIYERLRPGVIDTLNQRGLVLKSGPTKFTYQILETNVRIIKFGTGEWYLHPNSLYQYITIYRPQLWLALDEDWYRAARERIQILTEAPPLEVLLQE